MSRFSVTAVGHHGPLHDVAALLKLAANTVLAKARTLAADLKERRRIAKDYRKLTEMPDHILKDMGIGRSELRYLARHGRRP